jgi:ankyrin repeat/SOCS box protein 8
MTQLLLAAGASANAANAKGITPLMRSVRNPDCVRALIDTGASVESADEDGDTALMMWSAGGNVECLQLLLDRGAGATLDASNRQGALR